MGEPDFSGWATKAGLKCSDGRTITAEAFKHMDGQQVPLVWQHGHTAPENVLGHVILHAETDGVRADAFFNETASAVNAKALVEHKDIKSLSIYANQLVEKGKTVLHGMIREVSLVLSGANPGAVIDFVKIAHSDGEIDTLEDEAVIFTGLEFVHAEAATSTSPGRTVAEIWQSMGQDEKDVVGFLLAEALKEAGVEHDGTEEKPEEKPEGDESADETGGTEEKPGDEPNDKPGDKPGDDLEHKEGTIVTNVFEQGATGQTGTKRPTLTHDQLSTIVADAQKLGSFKEAFLAHVVEYGIENIDLLFPDARALATAPELVSRRMEWVTGVINGTRKSPFSRIKTLSADITHDEARAKGYVKATLKKEEWFGLTKRVTTPTTIYKKQKLDRDDIIDITDLDVVAWLKAEMRVMLDEEIARAVLVGDGREIDDEDKIDETHIRPIAYDDTFYNETVVIAANTTGDALVEAILRARPLYRGTGNPTLFMVEDLLTDLLLVKDKMGRRLYANQGELESALRVSKITTVPIMEDLTTDGGDILESILEPSKILSDQYRNHSVLLKDGDFYSGRLISEKKHNRLPVVDDEGRLVGVVTRVDVLASLTGG